MKKVNELGRVLFWLGLMTALGGMAAGTYLLFGSMAAWIETRRVVAVIWIGVALMVASFVIERLPPGKKRKR